MCSSMKEPPASPPIEELDESTSSPPPQLEHSFQPGDHVIRWEMLPIVYPIQIHGIVLECSNESVTIVDFGLTSYNDVQENEESETNEQQGEEEAVDEEVEYENKDNNNDTETDQAEQQQETPEEQKAPTLENCKQYSTTTTTTSSSSTVQQTKLTASDHAAVAKSLILQTSKSRLNVTTIRDSKQVNAWKRVNYGENIFSKSLKKSNSWWKLSTQQQQGKNESHGDDEHDNEADTIATETPQQEAHSGRGTETPTSDDSSDDSEVKDEAVTSDKATVVESTDHSTTSTEASPNNESSPQTMKQSPPSATPPISPPSSETSSTTNRRSSWWKPRRSSSAITPTNTNDDNPSSNDDEDNNGTSTKPNWWKSWTTSSSSKQDYQTIPSSEQQESAWADAGRPQLSQRYMNPAMSSLMKKKASTTIKQQPQQQALPKADPPKLVLARTKFLLQHGESVLPPYHVFSSNSECIAVWCMTGRWSTLQASVFLHSTAIGHAKTATAITLGVAATQPWLVPALAVVGGAAVGMPWMILKNSKEKWEAATLKLNDLFWAQAEPDVFVECIVKWSKLGVDNSCSSSVVGNGNDNDGGRDKGDDDKSANENVEVTDTKVQEEAVVESV